MKDKPYGHPEIGLFGELSIILEDGGGKSRALSVDWQEERGMILLPGGAAKGESLIITFKVPVRDIQGFWEPTLNNPVMEVRWHHRFEAAFHFSLPFLTFINRSMQNRFALGMTDPVPDTVVTMRLSQTENAWHVSLQRNLEPGTSSQEIFLSNMDLPWQAVFGSYRDIVAGNAGSSTPPEAAGRPVYCTWYAMHADITREKVLATARTAAELGFGTYIIDDGWQFDEPRRLTLNIDAWYAETGDWEISAVKLPEFGNMVEDIRRLGMKCLLWIAPTMVGLGSRACAEQAEDILPGGMEGCSHLYMTSPRQRERICSLAAELVKSYGLDGLKVDFLDAIRLEKRRGQANEDDCTTAGESMLRFCRALQEAVAAVKPEALLEYRQRYATAATAPYATQFRAGDVPFDFQGNRARIVAVRTDTGPGVICHADPAFWAPEECDVNVALHMINMLFAVPMVSIDFELYPPEHLQIIRHYLQLYGHISDTVLNGRFSAEAGPAGDWSLLRLEDGSRTIAGIYGPPAGRVDLSGAGEAILLNGLTGTFMGDYLLPCSGHIGIYDIYGRPAGTADRTEDLDVPIGGMAVINR